MSAFASRCLQLLAALVLCAQFSAHAQQPYIVNFQAATTVVGQANFTDQITTASQTVVPGAACVAVSAAGKMAVADSSANRVLIWNSIPLVNGAPADVVVGQANFTSTTGGLTASRMTSVEGVAFSPDGSKLFVCDRGNHRVLIWNTVPTTNDQPADVVIGQTNFTSNTSGLSATKLNGPTGVLVTPEGKLLVADNLNNRVLIYNSVPIANGASANLVLGQKNFTDNNPNDGDRDMRAPWSMTFSSDGKLLVADSGNNRVLIFNTFPTVNEAKASRVIGQNNFGQSNPGTTAVRFNAPRGVAAASDGQLAISEFGNNRVLIYNTIPTTNGAAATTVLGQPDFNSGAPFNGGVNAQSMAGADQIALGTDARLLVPGRDMHRVMIFGNVVPIVGPVVSTLPATNVVPTGAQLHGYVNPNGVSTDAYFQYSTLSDLSGAISTPMQNIGDGNGLVPTSAFLTGLLPATTYYFRAVGKNAGITVEGDILSFSTGVLNWGTAASDPTTGVLDPTLIPTSGIRIFTNVNGQGYDIVVANSNLNAGGGASYFGDSGWWFEGGGPSYGYGTVTYRFFDTVSGNPYPISGVDFRLLDAETDERFRSFGYWDASENFVDVPYGTGHLTFSHTPIYHATDNSYENSAPKQGGDQLGKWVELNLSNLSITGFTFQAHRQTASAGSVIMGDMISPFAAWRTKYFGPIPYLLTADDMANPDGDASINVLEYFFGTNPTVVEPNPLVMSIVASKVTLTFPRDTAATDITATVQGSDSASGPWTDLARSVNGGVFAPLLAGVDVFESPTGQIRTVEVRDLYLVGDPMHPTRFLRLLVVH